MTKRRWATVWFALAVIFVVIVLFGIWTDNEHWAETGYLFGGIGVLASIALIVAWEDLR